MEASESAVPLTDDEKVRSLLHGTKTDLEKVVDFLDDQFDQFPLNKRKKSKVSLKKGQGKRQ
jgi:hypothetical protein